MKRLFVTIFLLLPSLAGTTTKFVSANTGNDTNSGDSWADAYLTMGGLNGNLSAGDTAACVGTFTEVVQPTYDGTSGNKIIVMDSLSYTDGLNLTNPDTTSLWSAIIDGEATRGSAFDIGGEEYITFIGFDVKDCINQSIDISAGVGILFLQCRVRDHGDGGGSLAHLSSAGPDSVISCLFIGDAAVSFGVQIDQNAGNEIVFMNNTIIGDFTISAIIFSGTSPVVLINNLVENTSSTGADHAGLLEAGDEASISNWDNNLWYAPSVTNTWEFGGANFDLLATWVDSVNNYDIDGEENAKNEDPGTAANTTTAFITTASNAFGVAENNDFNDPIDPSAGWYQPLGVAGDTPATPKKGRPRFWGMLGEIKKKSNEIF